MPVLIYYYLIQGCPPKEELEELKRKHGAVMVLCKEDGEVEEE